MTDDREADDVVRITISTSAGVYRELERMTATGLYGRSVADVADRLLRERIRQVLTEGGP